MIKAWLMAGLTFIGGTFTGVAGERAYQTSFHVTATAAAITAEPTIHPPRPVSWWMQHPAPELAKMLPWCRDNDPMGTRYPDCTNATAAKMQLDLAAVIRATSGHN